jgi:hypothetical protein
MSILALTPEALGETIREVAEELLAHDRKMSQAAALYCEMRGGFSCRTCRFAVAQNATHGRCAIMAGTIHLDEGCCVLWDASLEKLRLYREPTA